MSRRSLGRRAALVLAAGLAGLWPAGRAAAQASTDTTGRVDAVFAQYRRDSVATPGCAVNVVRDGASVLAQGYGFASLDHRVPITPATVFDIGSDSKQFTAASIVLLALDGRLSLDDDIRRYVPELPALGTPVTLRALLTHTSGWRDYTDLLALDDRDERDHTTDDDALAALARQRAFNFTPGTSYRYSNTGYFLMSRVVRRVSGQSLRQFAQARLFGPLGMHDTRFLDDTRLVVPRRATGYTPGDSTPWVIEMSNWDQVGDGAVQTTVEDLAKWTTNFEHPTVGGDSLIALLQTPGRLGDGTRLSYALGLVVDTYRGVRRVEHGGAWAGYRAEIMRFPDPPRRPAVGARARRVRGPVPESGDHGTLDGHGSGQQSRDTDGPRSGRSVAAGVGRRLRRPGHAATALCA